LFASLDLLIFFFDGLDEVNNVVCANSSGSWTTLIGGLPGKEIISAIYFEPNNTFFAVTNDNQLYYYKDSWVESFPNIYGLYDWTRSTPQKKVHQWYIYVIIGCASVVAIVVGIVVAITIYNSKKKKNLYIEIPSQISDPNHSMNEKIEAIMEDPSITQIPEGDITFIKNVGTGGQGEVEKVMYKGKLAAAKSIPKKFFGDQYALSEFLYEIKLFSSLKHKNIISFYGVCVESERIWLIMEYMDLTLKDVMNKLKLHDKIRVSLSIAEAMKYLHHEVIPKVVHRDLKPENVMLNNVGECKLGDFGLGKVMTSMHNTKAVGTPDYMAPERIPEPNSDAVYSEKIDTFSFGVMISEMFGKKPFDFPPNTRQWQRTAMIRNNEVSASLPVDCPSEMKELIMKCLETKPENRPSFTEIVSALKLLQKT